jgi:hypothetical protein
MEFDRNVFCRSLEQLKAYDFVRSGDKGDSCYAWHLNIPVAEYCTIYEKTYTILSRFWIQPEDWVLKELARYDTILQVSISALDPVQHREIILNNLWRYEDFGGRVVPRVVTTAFNDDHKDLWDIQDDLMALPHAFQQPLKVRGIGTYKKKGMQPGMNPFLPLLDIDRFHKTKNYTNGKFTARWMSAGDLYHSWGCYGKCTTCSNECATCQGLWG